MVMKLPGTAWTGVFGEELAHDDTVCEVGHVAKLAGDGDVHLAGRGKLGF